MTALRAARIDRRMSAPEVSKQTGISATNLYRYETKERKLPVPIAKKLGALYGTKWETFYEEDNDGEAS